MRARLPVLTEEAATGIRLSSVPGEPRASLAKRLGVSIRFVNAAYEMSREATG